MKPAPKQGQRNCKNPPTSMNPITSLIGAVFSPRGNEMVCLLLTECQMVVVFKRQEKQIAPAPSYHPAPDEASLKQPQKSVRKSEGRGCLRHPKPPCLSVEPGHPRQASPAPKPEHWPRALGSPKWSWTCTLATANKSPRTPRPTRPDVPCLSSVARRSLQVSLG